MSVPQSSGTVYSGPALNNDLPCNDVPCSADLSGALVKLLYCDDMHEMGASPRAMMHCTVHWGNPVEAGILACL